MQQAEPLERLSESHAPEPLPPDYVMSREEEAILWRSLQTIPEVYREPLVLFYREHHSVEAVALALELSEDAVHQRLSRGRKLLQEQVLAFVEGTLARTNPGKAFTLAVLASLPGLGNSTKAVLVGAAATKSGATAKAAGVMGLLSAVFAPLAVILPNYFAYRVSLAGAQSEVERHRVKSLFGRAGLVTLAVFIPFSAAVLWMFRNQSNHAFLPGLFATGLVVIYLPVIWLLSASGKHRTFLTGVLTQQHAGVFPKPAWEYRSKLNLLGLPLVYIRIGDRFSLLKGPVKAWIALGDRAVGGLFAFGALAVAPLSIGGLSLGVLSIGGLAAGIFAVGGIAAGVWPLFGGVIVSWQAFDGCLAIGWNAAVGAFALAHDFALGHFVHAAQANNEVARHSILPNPFYRCAGFINRHWLWMSLFWLVPFFILWRTAKKIRTHE